MSAKSVFSPLTLCVLTVSDTRTPDNDSSGDFLAGALQEAGHRLHARALLPDDRYRLRALVSAWIAEPAVDGILVTGGTGFTGRDSTPEALLPLLDKVMPGFGEMFRAVSVEEIGTAALQDDTFAQQLTGARQPGLTLTEADGRGRLGPGLQVRQFGGKRCRPLWRSH